MIANAFRAIFHFLHNLVFHGFMMISVVSFAALFQAAAKRCTCSHTYCHAHKEFI